MDRGLVKYFIGASKKAHPKLTLYIKRPYT